MKKIFFTLLFILMVIVSFSQEERIVIPEKKEIPVIPVDSDLDNDTLIYDFVETFPEFPGGQSEMLKFIENNFVFPEEAKINGEYGRVYVGFVVYADGSIGDIKVLRGVSPSIDKEAIRVVKLMPNWIPGKQRGKPVNVRYTIPIKAKLE